MPDRPYLYYDFTLSLCHECLRQIEAKVVIRQNNVYLQKHCPAHGQQTALISSDADYYKRCREFIKPSQMPLKFNTDVRWGCPYDCGLCTDHEQHSCLALIDVTDRCNLQCPICYAESSPQRITHRSLEQIQFMLDRLVANEGEPDVVQISGGEPTIHPQFWEILDAAKRRPIKHLMLNTNGVRIADEPDFAARLAQYMPRFEVYLQFDSLAEKPLRVLRGEDLRQVRARAIEQLNRYRISTTLVVTLEQGLNDDEVGAIIDFGLEQPCVRGVTFQPVQAAGRLVGYDPARDRLNLSDVRRMIIDQSGVFGKDDLIPVPCHADCLCMGYALKLSGQVLPLTRLIDADVLLQCDGSDFLFERQPKLRAAVGDLFSAACSPDDSADKLQQLLCCLPKPPLSDKLGYENIFRVLIVQFLDAYNFDVRSVKKSCIHFVHPDGSIIPFDTYNLLYRDGQQQRLEQLRAQRAVTHYPG